MKTNQGIGHAGSVPLTGIVKQNLEPLPGCDSTQMRPAWRSMMRLQIANPIPVPG
jgi:hypothetical protein